MSIETPAVEHLDQRLGDLPTLQFPPSWTLTGSWRRAQEASAHLGPVNDAEWDILLERQDGSWGDKHRVLFAIYSGRLVAECDCYAYTHRQWCAHVAHLWWRWTLGNLAVTDLDADRTHLSPPWWLTVDDQEVTHDGA